MFKRRYNEAECIDKSHMPLIKQLDPLFRA